MMAEGLFPKLFPKEKEAPREKGPRDIKPDKPIYREDSREHPLPNLILKFKGICDWDRLYILMARWFKERKFEFHERLYKAKAPELELDWFAERKKTKHVMERVDINFHAFEVEELEVIKRGKKKKMLKMQITITFKMRVITGYPDIFGTKRWNSDIGRRMLDFYNKYIIKKDIDLLYTDALYYEVYKLHNMIKEHLELEGRGYTY